MAKRRWTVVFVPHGSEPSKIIEVSYGVIKVAAGGAAFAVAVALLVGYATMARRLRPVPHRPPAGREHPADAGDRASCTAGSPPWPIPSAASASATPVSGSSPISIRSIPRCRPPASAGRRWRLGRHARRATRARRRSQEIRVDLNALIRRANLLASSFEEAKDSLASHSQRLAATPSIMPTQGWLTSAFSSMREHPILHIARPHEGIDVTAPMGSPIEAPAAGVVTDAGWESGYGNTVTIDHGYGIATKFAHASKLLVKTGQRVSRGQRIALVGNTGLATGPHLHYEVHVNGRPVDPLKYVLPDRVVTD